MQFVSRRLMYKKEFDASYVGFMKDGAQWLVDNTDIKLVGKCYLDISMQCFRVITWFTHLIIILGIDYLSVAAHDDVITSHLVFLKSRVSIISLISFFLCWNEVYRRRICIIFRKLSSLKAWNSIMFDLEYIPCIAYL